MISNIASTSYLQDEVGAKVSIVHGKNVYLPWNEDDYGVSIYIIDRVWLVRFPNQLAVISSFC